MEPALRPSLSRTIDRELGAVPPKYLHAIVFLLALAAVISRRPEAVFNAQFWVEDGKLWYEQAYNLGAIHSLLRPQDGYFQTLSRLTGILAQCPRLGRAPLLLNLVAILVQILPAQLVVSSRFCEVGNMSTRLFLAFIYLALPNTSEIHSNITSTQWHLALLAFMVLIGAPGKGWGWRYFDLLVVTLCSLSGPFAILLTPIAALVWWKRHGPRLARFLFIIATGGLIQGSTMLYTTHFHRSHSPLGATPALLPKILADQVFLGAVVGKNALCHWSTGWAVIVGAVGMAALLYALIRGPFELKLLITFAALLLTASLASPTTTGPVPSWQQIELPGSAIRYWLVPMLAFVATLVWMLSTSTPRGVRGCATITLCLMCIGITRDWRDPAFADLNFQEYSRRFEESPRGTVFTIPLNPTRWHWSMRLVKH